MEAHEAAKLFPLDEEHLDELAADIKANGQKVPIEILDGMILDGRRRCAACERIGIKPRTIDKTGQISDPVSYVLSLNLHRRQLTPSQRTLVGAKAREIYDRQAAERMKAGKKNPPVKLPEGQTGDSRDLAGKAVGVSGKYIDLGTKVVKNAVPEVVQAVQDGRLNIRTAAAISTAPPDVQRDVAANPARAKGIAKEPETTSPTSQTTRRGRGVEIAHESIAVLKRIPVNDPLRSVGFGIVARWIRDNE